jgi:Winged helix DNA-binding domain
MPRRSLDRLRADQLRAVRVRAQLLSGDRPADVAAAVSRVAIQAQATGAARLAVRARTTGLCAADVDRAVGEDRAVVRTWLMRGTLHMVAAADVHWMVGLLGQGFAAAGRRRRLELGLDDRTCERGVAAIAAVLADSAPLTRAQLVQRIAEHGVRLDPTTQAPAHLLAYAALHGLIGRGPEAAGDEATYVLLDTWVKRGERTVPDDPLAELARRYLLGHGPAAARDFQAWSGLPAARVKDAFARLADEVREIETPDGPQLVPSTMDLAPRAERAGRLLGHFDAYLLGYRGRDLILEPRFARRIQAGGGIVRPAAVVDGRVVGTWQLRRARVSRLVIEPFETLPRRVAELMAADGRDIARFLGIDAAVEIAATAS